MGTIFYTDDDQDDTLIFSHALSEINKKRNANYKLSVNENGNELLNSLHNPPPVPNIIFLDLNMPGKDGRETLKEIRHTNEFKKLPVVIFSTSSNEEDIDFSYKHGANLYVNKPSNYEDLKRIISQCLDIDWKNYVQPYKKDFFISA